MHTQKKRLTFLQAKLTALAGRTEENGSALDAVLSDIREVLFPGIETKDAHQRQLEKIIQEEVKMALVIRPADERTRSRLASQGNDLARAWRGQEMKQSRGG